ncbi:MAG: septum formation initiator family protein [Clostridiales bacterium]|nr:septum formation initiator family protein [Clostridiales bacterium]
MRKTINVWALVATLAVILIVYFVFSSSLNKDLRDVTEQKAVADQQLLRLQEENQQLKEDLEYSTSDAYIENMARTEYGYMFPNEVQIVFDNPEALYGEENMPSP